MIIQFGSGRVKRLEVHKGPLFSKCCSIPSAIPDDGCRVLLLEVGEPKPGYQNCGKCEVSRDAHSRASSASLQSHRAFRCPYGHRYLDVHWDIIYLFVCELITLSATPSQTFYRLLQI